MFCKKCGKEIPDNSTLCPFCHENLNDNKEKAKEILNKIDNQVDDAIQDIAKDIINENDDGNKTKVKLKTDRSLVAYILLCLCTCNIYNYYFVYKLAKDINIAIKGDEDNTPGLGTYILLSFITCGFYSLYWEYKLGNRMYRSADRYGLKFDENGTTVLLWRIFGFVICCFGTFVGTHIIIKNANALCMAYNNKNNL